jgi:hypothetical protein
MPTREAWRLGALMNTRGLMELIVLNRNVRACSVTACSRCW